MLNLRKVSPNLRNDETVYVFARSTIWAFLPWLGITLGLIVIAGVLLFSFAQLGENVFTRAPLATNILIILTSAFLLLVLALLGVAFVDFYYDTHIVTEYRIITIDRNGLFSQNISELSLEDVEDVHAATSGLLHTLFNVGDVSIETAGEHKQFVFNTVMYPSEISELVLDLASQAKVRIERDIESPVIPRGQIKGVINNKLYRNWSDLVALGSALPGSPVHIIAKQQTETTSPAPTLLPKPLPQPQRPARDQAIPEAAIGKQNAPRPAAPTRPSQPQPRAQKPAALPARVIAQVKPPAVTSPPKAAKPSLPADDLDIIIDDPQK